MRDKVIHAVFFLLALRPPMGVVFYSPLAGFSLLAYEVTWSHTTTHHSRQDSSGRVINPSQRPLPDNTQHSQQTNIHAPGRIRTHNLSRRAVVDLCLRPRGHWDRLPAVTCQNLLKMVLLRKRQDVLQHCVMFMASTLCLFIPGESYWFVL